MANAGYSGTPLLKKLGLKVDWKVWLFHAPDNYFRWLDKDISLQLCKMEETPDWVRLFAANDRLFTAGMKKLQPVWRKNSGLVNIKVCAVSEQWSGLKLVVPVSKR